MPARLIEIPGNGLLLLLLFASVRLEAQSLEPRAFAPNPAGVNFVLGGWLRTDGDVLLNDSVPIEDFKIVSDAFLAGFGGTFGVGGRLASIGILVPYVTGDASGRLNGEPRAVHRSGLGDTSFRFTLSLLPDSALEPAEFRKKPLDRTLAASLVVVAPTGEYYDEKLINLSAHRWAFKPSIGGARQFGRWSVDGSAGVWLFTDNNEYLENSRREQDPIGVLDANLSYTFAPRLWLSGSFTWYAGGATRVDGESRRDTQNNTRAGLTLALPVSRQQSIKLSWGTGTSTRFGGQYDSYLISWQYLWFD